jgi:hypothetical protein
VRVYVCVHVRVERERDGVVLVSFVPHRHERDRNSSRESEKFGVSGGGSVRTGFGPCLFKFI